MRHRSTWLTAAAAVPLAASLLAAQTFDQTVGQTLGKDAALRSEETSLKQSVERGNNLMLDWQVLEPQQERAEQAAQAFELQHPGPGGQHPTPAPRPPAPRPPAPRPPAPRPPAPRPPAPRPPSPRPPAPRPPHPTPRPPHPGHPGNPGRPGHPAPRPGDRHGDWGRWPGHPGWGHHYGRWEERGGYWIWWGWVVWHGEHRAECLAYYDNLHTQCNGACEDEHADCTELCGGDADCAEQCTLNSDFCFDGCEQEWQGHSATCPAWLSAK